MPILRYSSDPDQFPVFFHRSQFNINSFKELETARISFSRSHLSRLLGSLLLSYTMNLSCESSPQSDSFKVVSLSSLYSEFVERVVLYGNANIVFEVLVQKLRVSSAAFTSLKIIELLEKFLIGPQLDRLFSVF